MVRLNLSWPQSGPHFPSARNANVNHSINFSTQLHLWLMLVVHTQYSLIKNRKFTVC